MSVQEEVIRRLAAAERRLETLESREVRRLITDYRWLRGYSDDFFGLSYDTTHHWTPATNGAASWARLQDGLHGGILRLQSNAANGDFATIFLGDAADGFDTLDPTEGFTIQVKMNVLTQGAAGNFRGVFGITDVARTRRIDVGLNRWQSANNWIIQCQDAAGKSTTNTGVAYNQQHHYHAIQVGPVTGGGRQVQYWLDGTLIGTHTTNIDPNPRTAFVEIYSGTADQRRLDLDWIRILPLT